MNGGIFKAKRPLIKHSGASLIQIIRIFPTAAFLVSHR